MIQFTKPTNLNGLELLNQLALVGIVLDLTTQAPEVDGNGNLWLDVANKDEAKVFLIVLDINMPVMNGWEFLDKLNTIAIKPLVKVIIVTSSIDSSDKDKAKEYDQVFEFMEKPLQER